VKPDTTELGEQQRQNRERPWYQRRGGPCLGDSDLPDRDRMVRNDVRTDEYYEAGCAALDSPGRCRSTGRCRPWRAGSRLESRPSRQSPGRLHPPRSDRGRGQRGPLGAGDVLPGPRQHCQEPCVALFETGEAIHSLRDERLVAAEPQGKLQQASRSSEPAAPPSPSDNLHGQLIAWKNGSSRVDHHPHA
jgi:hypothetical protein